MTLLLRMDDNMNRQLTCEFTLNETPKSLADELVTHGFINAVSHPRFQCFDAVGWAAGRASGL